MDNMNKEQYANWKQQFLEDKRKAYEAEPGVYNLIKMKRLFWRILAVYWVVHFVLSAIVSIQMHTDMNYVLEIAKTLFQIFWIYVFISPEGTWRINIMLYVSAAYNLMMIITNYRQSLQGILLQVFQALPLDTDQTLAALDLAQRACRPLHSRIFRKSEDFRKKSR